MTSKGIRRGLGCVPSNPAPASCDTEILPYVSGQGIIDLSMAGNRLPLAGRGVEVDIVVCAGTKEDASGAGQLPNEFLALHRAISLVSYCSGTSSIAMRR